MSADVLDLAIGNPDYDPPNEARVVAVRAIGKGLGGYAPMGGIQRLRAALAARIASVNGVPATPEQVVVTSGASMGAHGVLASVCQPGDAVLLPDPCFPLYRTVAHALHLRIESYPLVRRGDTYEPDWSALARLMSGARVLLWNFPSNPLGTVARPEWSARLFGLLTDAPGLTVLSDEVYHDLCFGHPHVPLAGGAGELADRIVSLYSFSKSYGMAAWRVGYLHTPRPELAMRVARTHWAASMSTSTVGQLAALAALGAPASYLAEQRAFVRANRDLAVAQLRAAGLRCALPEGGFFAWVDVRDTGLSATEFVDRCVRDTGVLLTSGDIFGEAGRGYVRLNYAVAPDRLADALGALGTWVGRMAGTVAVGADESGR